MKKGKKTLRWVIVIIVVVVLLRRILAIISVNIILFFDNLLYAGNSISAWIMWALLGLLLGIVIGAWVAFKKYKLAYSSVLLPLAVLLLFIIVLYMVNKPVDRETARLEKKTADANQFVTVVASGTLYDAQNSYAPANLLDNNDSTAWIYTARENNKIDFTFSSYIANLYDAKCIAFKLKNGYDKSQKIYKSHNRLQSFSVYNNGALIGTYTANDYYNSWQTININSIAVKAGDVLSLTINSVYKGRKYADQTAITELVPVLEFYQKPD